MKNKASLLLVVGLAGGLTVYALDQMSANSTGQLDAAVALLDAGQPAAARAMLSNITQSDPAYGAAQGYDALALYPLDKRKFLAAVESPAIQMAELPEPLREELDYKQVDALLFYRKFEQLLPLTAAFLQNHADSPQVAAVVEHQMAGLYERGMKNLRDATFTQGGKNSNDVIKTAQRLQAGRENLEQFLKLAMDREQNNYQTLTNRDLAVEVVKAMAALGGEAAALKMVAPADREKMALALIQLHNKNDTDADANLRRMTDFLNNFPGSKYGPRVKYEMADIALGKGEQLAYEAEGFERTRGMNSAAAARHCEAAPYLDMARGLFSGVVAADQQAGIAEADVQEAQAGILRVYYLKEDWASLSGWAAQMLTNLPPKGNVWLVTKLYNAAGLVRQDKLNEAASELDEVLATGFKGNPSYDGLLVSAAGWRIRVATQIGDEACARRIAQQVQSSVCYDSLKRTFVKRYGTLVAQSNPVSK